MTSKQNENKENFKWNHKPITYNPVRPLPNPDHLRTILGDTAVTTNVIGSNNRIIEGLFCYDAPEWLECH